MSQPAIITRSASEADAQGIARVLVDTWQIAYSGIVPDAALRGMSYDSSAQRALRMLRHEPCASFVAEQAATILGFAQGGPNRTRDAMGGRLADYDGEIYGLYVVPRAQRRGLGRTLTGELVRNLLRRGIERTVVWVLSANPARAFYEELGGMVIGEENADILGQSMPCVAYGWDMQKLSRTMFGAGQ